MRIMLELTYLLAFQIFSRRMPRVGLYVCLLATFFCTYGDNSFGSAIYRFHQGLRHHGHRLLAKLRELVPPRENTPNSDPKSLTDCFITVPSSSNLLNNAVCWDVFSTAGLGVPWTRPCTTCGVFGAGGRDGDTLVIGLIALLDVALLLVLPELNRTSLQVRPTVRLADEK